MGRGTRRVGRAIGQRPSFRRTNPRLPKFPAIFDTEGPGVICKAEFVNFAHYQIIVSFLQKLTRIMEDATEEQEMRIQLAELGLPSCTTESRSEVMQDSVEVDELLALLRHGNHESKKVIPFLPPPNYLAISADQCPKFSAIFDAEGSGVICKAEVVNFARLLMIASLLQKLTRIMENAAEEQVMSRQLAELDLPS